MPYDKAMKLLALAILTLVSLAQPVMSQSRLMGATQDYNKGLAAWIRGDHETALDHFKPLAHIGHTEAQYNLFAMYNSGKGFSKDNVMAYVWLTIAARNGHKLADYLDEKFAVKFLDETQIKRAQALVKLCVKKPTSCPKQSD